jgi:spermidine synthase
MMQVPLFIIGLISLLGQVILLRELNVAFFGVELVYLLALGGWLFLTALGALAGGRTRKPSMNGTMGLFILYGTSVVLGLVFLRASRLIFSAVPGAYLSFPEQMAAMVLALLPVGLLSGLLFQRTARMYVRHDRTLIGAYGIESAGGLAGGLIATAGLTWGVQNFALALACGLIALVTAVIYFTGKGARLYRTAGTALASVLLVLLYWSSPLDRGMTAWNHPNLLESLDTPYGRITLTKLHDQIAVFENDAIAFETQGTEAESFVHPAALQHPKPESVLILGGGIEGTVREILKHGPKRVDCVELNPAMMTAVLDRLPADVAASLKKPGVRLVVGDPRAFLKKSGSYDLILIGMPEPSSGQSNRFYTKEFFEQCAAKLHPRGVIALRLRSAENFWTPQLTRRTASIHRALRSVFPHVLLLPGATTVVTASRDLLPRSPEVLTERFEERKIDARLVSPPYLRYLLTNDRFAEIETRVKASAVPANSDLRPVCYSYTLMIWLSKFFPGMAIPDLADDAEKILREGAGPWWMGAAAAVLFLLLRMRPSWRNAALVLTAGFLGMVLEAILLLHYQVREGVLYQDIGLLLTLFMAGLALGSMAIGRTMRRQGRRDGRLRRVGAGMIAAFVLLCLFVLRALAANDLAGLAPTGGILAGAGFLVAGIFGFASTRDRQDQAKVISPLYAADLIGGCFGSILAGLFLIPLVGLELTLGGLMVLSVLALLLV